MEDFGVKDYNDFDTAISTTLKFNDSVEDIKTIAEQSKTTVSDGGVFKGPAAEGCSSAISSLMAATTESMDNFNHMNKYLHEVSDAYQRGDNEAMKHLLLAGNTTGNGDFKTNPVSSLKIPDGLGQRGYTVTGYGDKGVVYTDMSSVHWAAGTNQSKVFEEWQKQGGKYKNGIAVMNVNGQDCYLVATSSEAGKVGDNINIKLKNGQSFPAVVADQKSSNDWNYTQYGHADKAGNVNVVEFEVDMKTYKDKGCNPNTSDWGLEWDSSSGVSEIDNYGSIVS